MDFYLGVILTESLNQGIFGSSTSRHLDGVIQWRFEHTCFQLSFRFGWGELEI